MKKPALRILFNDAHSNMPGSTTIAAGGPSRFAHLFSSYFSQMRSVERISVLFSYESGARVYSRKTVRDHAYYEVVYNSDTLRKTFMMQHTRRSYEAFLAPWLREIDAIFEDAQPTIVFLNGFNLTNWMLLRVANKRGVPVYIQHAGIWKAELSAAISAFSPSIRRIFASFEKDTIKWATQIFLNEWSRELFARLHHINDVARWRAQTHIIPLPVATVRPRAITIPRPGKPLNIAMVARWDRIKNHGAFFRLARYYLRQAIPMSLSVVTQIPPAPRSTFKDQYPKTVKIVNPMLPDTLRKFYQLQDVCIIPSRVDISPTVCIEAVLAGVPVIISEHVGWVSLYRAVGLDKLIVSPTSSGARIAEAVTELIRNPGIYRTRFTQLQQIFRTTHAAPVVFDQYYQCFTKL